VQNDEIPFGSQLNPTVIVWWQLLIFQELTLSCSYKLFPFVFIRTIYCLLPKKLIACWQIINPSTQYSFEPSRLG